METKHMSHEEFNAHTRKSAAPVSKKYGIMSASRIDKKKTKDNAKKTS
jgi:hypothetical protein